MLRVQLLGITYHRMLAEQLTPADTATLKQDDYSFVVCYGNMEDPDYHITAKTSCMIDLSAGLDAAFARFNPTSRNEVRRADRMPELAFHNDLSAFNFDTYYAFHTLCEHNRNWFPVPPEELKNSLVFSATHNGVLIAGMSCYAHGKRLRVGRIYSNKRSHQSEVLTNLVYGVASKRIVYEICKYACDNGYVSLDLGGVDLTDPAKAGISQFKLSLGGTMQPVILARYSTPAFKTAEARIKEQGWDLT